MDTRNETTSEHTTLLESPALESKVLGPPHPGEALLCTFHPHPRKRKCRNEVLKNSQGLLLCGAHIPAGVAAEDGRVKVLCPNDPLHMVWNTKLGQHLKRCRARNPQPGSQSDTIRGGRSVGAAKEQQPDLEPSAVARCSELVRRNALALDIVDLPADSSPHASFERVLARHRSGGKVGPKKQKHLRQETSIIRWMDAHDMLGSPVYLELGCGSANLSAHLQEVLKGRAHHLLLDRLTFRSSNRRDGAMRAAAGPGAVVHRMTVDLADWTFSHSLLRGSEVACISKHLCGPATDHALRRIAQHACAVVERIHVCVATCCHHLCDWDTYGTQTPDASLLTVMLAVNPSFFSGLGLSRDDFYNICRMSAWATLTETEATRAASSTADTGSETETLSKRSIGILCKRLIDLGRLEFLRTQRHASFRGMLVTYTTESPESTLLVATHTSVKSPHHRTP